MRNNTGRFPPSRTHARRPKSWQSWDLTNPSIAGRINADTNRLTYSPEQKSTNIQIKNRRTHHQNFFFFASQTLWRPHRDHPGPKPTWWHPASQSSVGIHTTMRINAGHVPSTRIHVGRVNKKNCDHGGWTTHSHAMLKSTVHVYYHAHKELKIPSIQIKHSWPNHVNELHNKTLW